MTELYWDAGITFNGLLDARPHDMLGIGFSYIGVSSQIIDYSKEQGFPVIPSFEGRLEISYTAQLMQGLTLQPDFQYFWNPGGHRAIRTTPPSRPPMPPSSACAPPSITEQICHPGQARRSGARAGIQRMPFRVWVFDAPCAGSRIVVAEAPTSGMTGYSVPQTLAVAPRCARCPL